MSDNRRRTLLKGTAGILASGMFPAVHAQEKITLRYLGTAVNQDKSIAEVAELIGVPANTVKTRMFRARSLMGQLLKGHAIEQLDALDGTNHGAWLRSGPQELGRHTSRQEEAYA